MVTNMEEVLYQHTKPQTISRLENLHVNYHTLHEQQAIISAALYCTRSQIHYRYQGKILDETRRT